jgi:hypothetical protein
MSIVLSGILSSALSGVGVPEFRRAASRFVVTIFLFTTVCSHAMRCAGWCLFFPHPDPGTVFHSYCQPHPARSFTVIHLAFQNRSSFDYLYQGYMIRFRPSILPFTRSVIEPDLPTARALRSRLPAHLSSVSFDFWFVSRHYHLMSLIIQAGCQFPLYLHISSIAPQDPSGWFSFA